MSVGEIQSARDLALQALSSSAAGTEAESAGGTKEAAETFGRLLTQAVDDLNQVNSEANEAVARLAAGESVELHNVMIAVEEADLSLRLALQVRNKLVEAYREIQRMQV
ncbi:MAG: Flagellar hook-basal body complex protein FliE [Anaerolineales bacterium]|nr:Flagellar hook-basal body complex protein FliE [Anaerolineales bacterium]